jgi:hypothetical protein
MTTEMCHDTVSSSLGISRLWQRYGRQRLRFRSAARWTVRGAHPIGFHASFFSEDVIFR